MPIADGLLPRQREAQQLGRIRIGAQVDTGKTNRDGKAILKPVTLEKLRLTSPAKFMVEAAAAAFGGEARPWANPRGGAEWEVYTDATELLVSVPPWGDVFSLWFEMWGGGGNLRRCDGKKLDRSGAPCLCAPLLAKFDDPRDQWDERKRLAALRPPKACLPILRMSMILPDLPDVGVWRLDTKSVQAARHITSKLAMMEAAREQGVYLPARVWVDHQVHVAEGQTSRYPVVSVNLTNTIREIVGGDLEAGGWDKQLPPAPGGQRPAITGGQAPALAPPAAVDTAEPAEPDPDADWEGASSEDKARRIVDAAREATTREDIEVLVGIAERVGVIDDEVAVDVDGDVEVLKPLKGFLQDRWRELPHAGGPAEAEPVVEDPPPPLPPEPADDGGLFAAATPAPRGRRHE